MSRVVDVEERDRLFFELFEITQQGISRVSWDAAWAAAEDHLLTLLGGRDVGAMLALSIRENAVVRKARGMIEPLTKG